ncbi:hypothetical protein ABK040_011113 [Willaertia magna]
MENFSIDILFKISEFFNNIKDYLSFFQTNKFIYENVLKNNTQVLRSEMFKKKLITLTSSLPNYLFQIESLNLNKKGNDFNLLENFKYLKYLNIKRLNNEEYILQFPFLKELVIYNSFLFNNNLLSLQNLNSLTLQNCNLNDDCLNNLNNLMELNIIECEEINGECLQNLKMLTKFYFKNFKIENNIFTKHLENLMNLKHLNLLSCKIDDSSFLQKLTNLESLEIKLNNIVEENFYNLKKLTKLIVYTKEGFLNNCFKYLLNLEKLYCDLSIIKDITQLKNIKKLKLFDVNDDFKEETLQLFKLNTIFELNVNYLNNDISGKYFNEMINLKYLYIAESLVKDEHLMNLNKLKELDINGCEINGKCLQNMNLLTYLEANNTYIEDKYLNNLKKLKILQIQNCKNINGECLQYLINLKELDATGTNIEDKYVMNLKKLHELNLEQCINITGECLLHLNNLHTLIVNNTNIEDKYFLNLTKLKVLIMHNCKHITGECLQYLSNLVDLNISYSNNVEEKYLENLLKLRYLNFTLESSNIKTGKFLLNMNKLQHVMVDYTHSYIRDAIEEVKERIRNGAILTDIFQK